ncbi:MAG: glycerophosphodiester phosphodiesterase [Eubacteriales bacterium]|nr:glycerophosphodiester phosphodiesterase [Eubacteriales bacterium]
MRTLAKETWQIASQNWKHILLFEILYRAVTLPAYLRFVNRSLRLALELAGYSYLTAENVGSFLIRPWTVCIAAVVCLIGAMLLMLETAGLITAFQGSAYYQKLTPFHMLWGGLGKVAEEIRRKNWRLLLLVSVQYCFANLLFAGRAVTHVKPVNFIIQEMGKEPWALAFAVVLVLSCFLSMFPLSFAAYGCMIEQKSFEDGKRRSRDLMKGRQLRIFGLLAGINLAAVAAVFLAYVAAVVAAAVFVRLFTEKNLAMAVLLFAADQIEGWLLFFGSILVVVLQYAALSVMYYQYGNRRFHTERWDFQYPAKGTANWRRLAGAAAVIACLGLFYVFDLVRNGSAWSDEVLIQTQITAHRGSSKSAPENTMAAVLAAMDEMADSVEVDVQMTSDGVVVLGHDASLKRVAGVNRSIGSMTWEELSGLDVGSWFDSRFAGETIPTLESVLNACRGKLSLNIEIKNMGPDSSLPDKVTGLILDSGMEEQCVVTSTSLNYLKRVKELGPQLRTGYIISAAYGNFYSNEAVDFISIRSSFVNYSLVSSVHAQGKGVYAWTVNSKSEMERLVLLGVDGIITDRPVLAREIIYREKGAESLMEYVQLMLK